MQDYGDEVQDFFTVDKQLAAELEYDMRRYQEQLAEQQQPVRQAAPGTAGCRAALWRAASEGPRAAWPSSTLPAGSDSGQPWAQGPIYGPIRERNSKGRPVGTCPLPPTPYRELEPAFSSLANAGDAGLISGQRTESPRATGHPTRTPQPKKSACHGEDPAQPERKGTRAELEDTRVDSVSQHPRGSQRPCD